MMEISREVVEEMADPARCQISLIYNVKGQVIGNSQALAKTLLKLYDGIDQFILDAQMIHEKLGKALS